jgi:hypothetical protein
MRKPLEILYNFHWVVPGEAARSSQAYLRFLGALLQSNGLRAMINLRGHPPRKAWWPYEAQVCARLGVVHIDAMLDSRHLPLKPMLCALFDAFDAAPRPFLVKCSGGQDRTSLASALYVVHRFGWAARDEAMKQFAALPYLHVPRQHQRWLRHFLAFAHARSKGASLAEWVRAGYEPEDLAGWLRSRGMGASFAGIWKPWPARARR